MNDNAAVAAASAAPLPWKRSIVWLLFLGPFFFLSYGFANHLAAERGLATSFYYAWERHIPFLPWTIVPYWSIDLLYGFSFLCCRDAREVDRHGLRLLTAQLIAVACFLAFPLRFAFERPGLDGPFGLLFDALTSFDQPYNQAPSLHIALLILIWVQFARLPAQPAQSARSGFRAGSRRALRLVIHGWALLIGISVLTTWQHHFIDVPTGALLGLFCLWLWPDHEHTPLRRGGSFPPLRRRLALLYACAALVSLALADTLARHFSALFLFFFWLASALALVAWNYAWAGAGGFQKRAGRASLAAAWLFAPYTLAAWLNSRLWTRRRSQADHVAEGVWFGRLPTARNMRSGAYAALCDLTAELPAPAGPWRYVNHPWLDLAPPNVEQLLAAARSIENLRQGGPLLVACALGYSRSAGAVAAWLCLSGHCPDMASALALLGERRPGIVINPALHATLAAAENHIRAGNMAQISSCHA